MARDGMRSPSQGWAQGPSVALGVALALAYALPLFFPPPASSLLPPATYPDLVGRLFPGVPGWWVLGRMACLMAGVVLLTAALDPRPAFAAFIPERPRTAADRAGGRWLHVAVAAATGHALVGLLALPYLGPIGQLAYVGLLPLPALLLLVGRPESHKESRALPHAALLVAATIVIAWVFVRIPAGWHSPRTADPVDMWHSYRWLTATAAGAANPLLQSGQPGIANVYMVLLGEPVLAMTGGAPSTVWVQAVHGVWLAAAALTVAMLAATVVAPATAVTAVAAFLFSPFVLLMPHSVAPFGIFLFLGAAMLLLLVRYARSGSSASLVGLATVAGLACMSAYLYHLVALVGLAVVWLAVGERQRPARLVAVAAVAAFLAAALPSLPDLDTIRHMFDDYVMRRGQWANLESILHGQRSVLEPPGPDALWTSGRRGPLDVALGSLLSPLASPRTPLRLWGDALFDPVATVLAAIGLAACLRAATSGGTAAMLVALAAACVAPAAMASAYDRASLIRNVLLPIPIALLAATGVETLRVRLAGGVAPLAAAVAASVVIAGSGVVLYDVVTPRLLPASFMTIALEAVDGEPSEVEVRLLEHGRPLRIDWMHVDTIGAALARPPIETVVYDDPRALRAAGNADTDGVLMWSPALERDEDISRVVCLTWPGAALYTLFDRTGFSMTHAARPAGSGWTPRLPPTRWIEHRCGSVPELQLPYSGKP